MVGVVGAFTLAVTLVYVRTWFGFLYGLAAGLVAAWPSPARLKPAVSEVLLAAIGATSVLYAVWDVASDVLFRHSGQSDAAALARLTGVPAVAWGVLWVIVSVAVLLVRPAAPGLSGRAPRRGMKSPAMMHESHAMPRNAGSIAVQSGFGPNEEWSEHPMKRIGILTAGGDTPALNATIHGAVVRANQRRVEVYGFIKGYSALLNPSVPHVHLNPLFTEIPELDPTRGGTVIGASRDFVDSDDTETIAQVADRLKQLKIDGLICVGGDGTLNGLQPFAELFPVVLAPKTIDNDLGLNYRNEPDEWERESRRAGGPRATATSCGRSRSRFDLDEMVNYVTPGYATAVFVSVQGRAARAHHGREPPPHRHRRGDGPPLGLHRPRHRLRPARHHPRARGPGADPRPGRAGPRALRPAEERGHRVRRGHRRRGRPRARAAKREPHDPAGNVSLSGAVGGAARSMLVDRIGDDYFQQSAGAARSADAAIFTRKVGHTQRGGRPILFDRFYGAQLGGKAVDMLLDGQNNAVAILQWNRQRRVRRRQLRRQRASATAGASSTPGTMHPASTTPS